ncbi:MAG: TldD/PmbA family protein [Candidatus Micrarchaeia archaeon]
MDAEHIVKEALGYGFDEVVASVSQFKRVYVKIANSKIDSVVEKSNENAYLFVTSKKRVFFTNIERLDKSSVSKAIKTAKHFVNVMKPKSDYFGIAKGPFKYKLKLAYDKRLSEDISKEAGTLARTAVDELLELGASNVAGTAVAGVSYDQLATSNHVDANSRGTMLRLSLRPFFGTVTVQDVIAGRLISSIKPEKVSQRMADMALSIRSFGKLKSGIYDVIYAPSPAGLIISNANYLACASAIETGSPFTGKLGKEVATKELTLLDSGVEPDGVDSSPYDSEGYPTQRTVLIGNGILKTYLHNSSTAAKYHTKSTGNAGLVDPLPNTPVLLHKNRKRNLDVLIGEIDKGVLITNTWYLRFSNDVNGAFSTVPRDLAVYIEQGEPKFAIKHMEGIEATGVRISDSIPHMLKNIEAIGGEAVQSTSWDTEGSYYFMPYVLARGVRFTVA